MYGPRPTANLCQIESTLYNYLDVVGFCCSCFESLNTMKKSISSAVNKASDGNAWKKFTDVTVGRGKTVYPKSSADQERVGVRWDYDGEVTRADGVYNKFQMQPNAGKVPSSIRQWRDEHGGTHSVMASAFVKKGGSKDDVKKGLEKAAKSV
ncbi:hypothetical protein PMIN02_004654 [Paraphaeosphaeria minitans]